MKTILADHEGDPGGICRHGAEGMHSHRRLRRRPGRRRAARAPRPRLPRDLDGLRGLSQGPFAWIVTEALHSRFAVPQGQQIEYPLPDSPSR